MTKNSLFLGQRLETKRRQRTDQRLDKKNSLFLDQRLDTQRQQRTVSSWVRDWIHRDDKEQSLFWVRGWRCSAEMTKNSLFLGQRLDKKNSLFLDQRLDTQRQQRTVSSWVRDWIHRDDKEQSLFWVRGWRCSAEMTKNSLFLGQRLDTQRQQRMVSCWVRGWTHRDDKEQSLLGSEALGFWV